VARKKSGGGHSIALTVVAVLVVALIGGLLWTQFGPRPTQKRRKGLHVVRVQVMNGSGEPGVGTRVAQFLREGGFQVVDVRRAGEWSTGHIEGSVMDEAGKPLDGVVISALGNTTAFAVSDKAGQFTLRQLPPGPYLLRAHLQGFLAPRSTMVNVRPAVRSASSFTLRREATAGAPRVADAGFGATDTTGAIAAPAGASAGNAGRDESDFAWRLRHLKRGVLPDAGDLIQRGAQAGLLAQLAVVGDGEAVRLVTHASQVFDGLAAPSPPALPTALRLVIDRCRADARHP